MSPLKIMDDHVCLKVDYLIHSRLDILFFAETVFSSELIILIF